MVKLGPLKSVDISRLVNQAAALFLECTVIRNIEQMSDAVGAKSYPLALVALFVAR